jgi:hypothetical protein
MDEMRVGFVLISATIGGYLAMLSAHYLLHWI